MIIKSNNLDLNIRRANLRQYRKSSKHNLILTSELEEIIIGLMLGDLFA